MQLLFVFTRRQDRLLCVMDMFFAADRNEFNTSSSVVLYFKSSQIYLFDRILATSCFSAKTDTCFKITKFMFHNHIQTNVGNDKVQPLPFTKN